MLKLFFFMFIICTNTFEATICIPSFEQILREENFVIRNMILNEQRSIETDFTYALRESTNSTVLRENLERIQNNSEEACLFLQLCFGLKFNNKIFSDETNDRVYEGIMYFAQKLAKENNTDESSIQEAIRLVKSISEKREGFDSTSESKDRKESGLLASLQVRLTNIQRNKNTEEEMKKSVDWQTLLSRLAGK